MTEMELFQPVEPPDHEEHRGGKPPKVKISKKLSRKVFPTAVPGISLTNYRVGPSGKGWGAHCEGNRTTITLSNGVRITVRSEISELLRLILNECLRRGYVIRQADTGAFNCRKIAGSNTWSNHAWALACDINWQLNPMRRPLTTNIPVWMRQLFNRYGFAWGGDYSGTPDSMHFEFMGTPAQAAQATAIAQRELGGAAPVPTPPPNAAHPPILFWPLPAGHWFGNVNGGVTQHGGDLRWDTPAVHAFVKNIQQWLIYKGCVPGQTNWQSGWADGVWEDATDGPMITWHNRFYPGQQAPAQCWADDYLRLARP